MLSADDLKSDLATLAKSATQLAKDLNGEELTNKHLAAALVEVDKLSLRLGKLRDRLGLSEGG